MRVYVREGKRKQHIASSLICRPIISQMPRPRPRMQKHKQTTADHLGQSEPREEEGSSSDWRRLRDFIIRNLCWSITLTVEMPGCWLGMMLRIQKITHASYFPLFYHYFHSLYTLKPLQVKCKESRCEMLCLGWIKLNEITYIFRLSSFFISIISISM